MIQLYDQLERPIARGDILLRTSSYYYGKRTSYQFGVANSIDDRKRQLNFVIPAIGGREGYESYDDQTGIVKNVLVMTEYFDDLARQAPTVKSPDEVLEAHDKLEGTQWPELYPPKKRQQPFARKWSNGFSKAFNRVVDKAKRQYHSYWAGGQGKGQGTFQNQHNHFKYYTNIYLGELVRGYRQGDPIPKILTMTIDTGKGSTAQTIFEWTSKGIQKASFEIDGLNLFDDSDVKTAVNLASQKLWRVDILK